MKDGDPLLIPTTVEILSGLRRYTVEEIRVHQSPEVSNEMFESTAIWWFQSMCCQSDNSHFFVSFPEIGTKQQFHNSFLHLDLLAS